MVPRDQPGVVGVAARLPSRPGSQNEIPLSSAREISGQRTSAAAAAKQPIRRIFDSTDAIAHLQTVLQWRLPKQAAKREGLKFRRANELPGSRTTLDSKSQAAP